MICNMKAKLTLGCFLIFSVCLTPMMGGEGRTQGPPTTNICDALAQAKVVVPPDRVEGLLWLTGKWKCVDRMLRLPPSEHDFYTVLNQMDFDETSIRSSLAYTGGFTLIPLCSFIPFGDGKQVGTNVVAIEFHSKGFDFNMPLADVLTLKRDPREKPEWFVLEHGATRNVLLFRRIPLSVERKTESKQK